MNPLVAFVLSLTIVAGVSAQENKKDDEYLRWPRQQAETVGKSTYHDGKVGSRLYPWDTRVLKTERSQNYKLRATWFTPEVIRASARWAQLQSHLTDKETEALVSDAEAVGDTVVMVEIDPNEGSGVIPLDWEAFLQPKSKTGRNDGVRGVEKSELRKLRGLQGVMQRNYDYDRFWVVFPLVRADGRPLASPTDNDLELVVRIYNREGAVNWGIPTSIRLRANACKTARTQSP